jgi:hypothetical protein
MCDSGRMSSDPARVAFEQGVATVSDGTPPSVIRTIGDPALAVPGFTTFEAMVGDQPVRGWSRADGTTVLSRTISFGPLLEALEFRDDDKSPSAREVAERMAWMHGPRFKLVDRVAEGECGAPRTLHVAPERDTFDDGRVEFRFALKYEETEVIQYRVFGHPDGHYDIKIYPLAPK